MPFGVRDVFTKKQYVSCTAWLWPTKLHKSSI